MMGTGMGLIQKGEIQRQRNREEGSVTEGERKINESR